MALRSLVASGRYYPGVSGVGLDISVWLSPGRPEDRNDDPSRVHGDERDGGRHDGPDMNGGMMGAGWTWGGMLWFGVLAIAVAVVIGLAMGLLE